MQSISDSKLAAQQLHDKKYILYLQSPTLCLQKSSFRVLRRANDASSGTVVGLKCTSTSHLSLQACNFIGYLGFTADKL